MLRRLAGARVSDRGDYFVIETPQNPGFYWGNFLLLAEPPAPGSAEHWLDLFTRELPAAEHVALGIVTDGRGLARYQAVETHPEHRRQGLARALVLAAGELATDRFGVGTLVIVADPGYVAIDLYRNLGFVDRETQVQLQRAP